MTIGKHMGLIIIRSISALCPLEKDPLLDVTIDGKVLIIHPVRDGHLTWARTAA